MVILGSTVLISWLPMIALAFYPSRANNSVFPLTVMVVLIVIGLESVP